MSQYTISVAIDVQRGFLWQLMRTDVLIASGFAHDKQLAQRVAETVRKLMEAD